MLTEFFYIFHTNNLFPWDVMVSICSLEIVPLAHLLLITCFTPSIIISHTHCISKLFLPEIKIYTIQSSSVHTLRRSDKQHYSITQRFEYILLL